MVAVWYLWSERKWASQLIKSIVRIRYWTDCSRKDNTTRQSSISQSSHQSLSARNSIFNFVYGSTDLGKLVLSNLIDERSDLKQDNVVHMVFEIMHNGKAHSLPWADLSIIGDWSDWNELRSLGIRIEWQDAADSIIIFPWKRLVTRMIPRALSNIVQAVLRALLSPCMQCSAPFSRPLSAILSVPLYWLYILTLSSVFHFQGSSWLPIGHNLPIHCHVTVAHLLNKYAEKLSTRALQKDRLLLPKPVSADTNIVLIGLDIEYHKRPELWSPKAGTGTRYGNSSKYANSRMGQ